MRVLTAILGALILVACGTRDDEPAAGAEAVAATSSLAQFAGAWSNAVTLEGVGEPVPSTMSGSAAGNDWTMSLPDRENISIQVHMKGDSLIGQSAEYESILRPGVTVDVRTASVLRDGGLVGNVLATYRTPNGEEQVRGTMRGTRAP
jgi:prolipoprotein diacylglyceryltransferase